MKVAFLVTSTSRKRSWITYSDGYLSKILLPSLNKTAVDHEIHLYVGHDDNDPFYLDAEIKRSIENEYPHIKIHWKSFGSHAYQGNPVGIWNTLGKNALSDGIDYMFVCGDDIQLDKRKEWLGVFIKALRRNDNIGWTAGYSNTPESSPVIIPTQFLLHRKHIEIMGCIYPPELRNWFCDNWLAQVYPEKYMNWIWTYKHMNLGGSPRYDPIDHRLLHMSLVKKYRKRLSRYNI